VARPVAVTALACAALHAAAGLGSLLLLAGGSSAVEEDVGARIAYIEAHETGWRIGWLLWAVTGVAVLLFYHALARVGAARTSAMNIATTALIGAAGGALLLEERLVFLHAAALAAILAGAALLATQRHPAAAGPAVLVAKDS